MVPCLLAMFQTGSPLATVTANHRANHDFPTLGEPARMCSPWDSSVSTTKLGGRSGWLISAAPSTVRSFGIGSFIINTSEHKISAHLT